MTASDPIPLTDENALDRFLAQPGLRLLFKHSTACPVSAAAHDEMGAFLRRRPGLPVGLVRVIEERRVSDEVARRLGVRHESPQALLLRNGKVLWHASHGAVTAAALERACARAVQEPPPRSSIGT